MPTVMDKEDQELKQLVAAIYDMDFAKFKEICTKNPGIINKPYNENGWTPFMLICRNIPDVEWIGTAIDLGGDVETRNAVGLTPFLIAARKSGDVLVLDTLLYEGFADLNETDNDGWNALMIAATHHWGMWFNSAVIEYLMDQGIDLDHKTNDGRTILEVVDNEEVKTFITRYIKKKQYFDSIGGEMPMSHRDERWLAINYTKNKHDKKTKKDTDKD